MGIEEKQKIKLKVEMYLVGIIGAFKLVGRMIQIENVV